MTHVLGTASQYKEHFVQTSLKIPSVVEVLQSGCEFVMDGQRDRQTTGAKKKGSPPMYQESHNFELHFWEVSA